MSSSSTCSRPAVSTISTSYTPLRAASSASRAMSRRLLLAVGREEPAPTCSASRCSCSIAAGRRTSVLTSSTRFLRCSRSASARACRGGRLARALQAREQHDHRRLRAQLEAAARLPMSATSSSWMIPMKAWPGVRLAAHLGAERLRFTRSMKVLTTGSATSASSSAMRTSRSASPMFSSVMRPAAAQRVDRARQPRGQILEKCHGGRIIEVLCYGAYARRTLLRSSAIALRSCSSLLIAFSSGTEVAMLSANRYKIRAPAKAGKRTAQRSTRCSPSPTAGSARTSCVLALASVAASAIATLLAQRTGYEHAVPVTIGGARDVHDRLLRARAEDLRGAAARPVALSSTYIYKVLVFVATPITWFTNKAAYGFLRAVRREAGRGAARRCRPKSCARWWPRPAR